MRMTIHTEWVMRWGLTGSTLLGYFMAIEPLPTTPFQVPIRKITKDIGLTYRTIEAAIERMDGVIETTKGEGRMVTTYRINYEKIREFR